MIVCVDADGTVLLRDPSNYSELKVIAESSYLPQGDWRQFDHESSGADYVMLSVEWLKGQSSSTVGVEAQKFDRMLDYAQSKGWTGATRRWVRAHVEWTSM